MHYKSPFNYIGNKYRMIGFLLDAFPQNTRTFVDLFCGGGDVVLNYKARRRRANDINHHLIGVMQELQRHSAAEVMDYIDSTISEWQLSKTNKEAYNNFREHYNRAPQPLDLFILLCFSFNHQLRFNNNHLYNNPFGRDRSSFNKQIRTNLDRFISNIGTVEFTSLDFRDIDYDALGENDFLYADPPYLLTCGSYNDGKRGFKGWGADDDTDLLDILDRLDRNNVRFALSNVIEHKGLRHPFLMDWAADRGYTLLYPGTDYSNCNYHRQDAGKDTIEVLIRNFRL